MNEIKFYRICPSLKFEYCQCCQLCDIHKIGKAKENLSDVFAFYYFLKIFPVHKFLSLFMFHPYRLLCVRHIKPGLIFTVEAENY
jgi:hypothetical protein